MLRSQVRALAAELIHTMEITMDGTFNTFGELIAKNERIDELETENNLLRRAKDAQELISRDLDDCRRQEEAEVSRLRAVLKDKQVRLENYVKELHTKDNLIFKAVQHVEKAASAMRKAL